MTSEKRKRTPLHSLIRQLSAIFEELRPKRGKLPQREYSYFLERLQERMKRIPHQRTLHKAREALGVKSVQRQRTRFWTFPTRSLEEALKSISYGRDWPVFKVRKSRAERDTQELPGAIDHLTNMMKAFHYDVSAVEIQEEFYHTYIYRPALLYKAKRALEIESMWDHDNKHWRWVYAPEEVQDWLTDQVPTQTEAVSEEDLCALALKEKSWSRRVVMRGYRELDGYFERIRRDNKVYWHALVTQSYSPASVEVK